MGVDLPHTITLTATVRLAGHRAAKSAPLHSMARKFALVEREEEEESSSEEEEEEEEPQEQHDEESGGEEEGEQDAEPAVTTPVRANNTKRGKLKIKISRHDRASCKVRLVREHRHLTQQQAVQQVGGTNGYLTKSGV